MKRLILAAAALAVPLFVSASKADTVMFDPDGAGGAAAFNLASIDLDVGNALGVNATSGNALLPGQSVQFQQLFQAKLAHYKNDLNQNINAPAGAELTAIAGFNVVATKQTDGALAFSLASGPSFLQFFVGGADASDLGGTGFADGTRILDATVIAVAPGSRFTVNTVDAGAFDQFGTNNYSGISSVGGTGSFTLVASVNSVNTAFFLPFANPLTTISLVFAPSNTALPFVETDPSHLFTNYNPGTNTYNTVTPTIGSINGITGPDIQLQTDASAALITFTAPTPASAAAGFLLTGIFGATRLLRRRTIV